MKCLLRFLFCSFISVFLVALSVTAKPPHIIVLIADDLGWADVSYHGGNISTPNIDKLASRGVQLDQFYVQPVCSPTRAALMTGRYPMRFGMQCGVVRPWASHGLPTDEQTLADGLRSTGYTTSIVGKWHLGHADPGFLPLQRGFDTQYGHYNGALDYFTHIRDGGHDWHRNDEPLYEEGYTTDLIGEEAARIIKEHDEDKPLFLYVPFNAPHTPLQATEEHLERNKHIKNENRRTFAAMVTNMDEAVGEILAAANKYLPRDNTLIFFSSDNGGITRLGSNGSLRNGKSSLYEGGVRVVAMMAWDGTIEAGGKVEEPLHMVDIYPTLLELAGAQVDQQFPIDGYDVWSTITRGNESPHDFILLNVTPFGGAIRMGDWKLVHNGAAVAGATTATGSETWELFDLKKDPSEKSNLVLKNSRIFRRLKSQLDKLEVEAMAPHIPPNRLPDDFKVPKIWGHAD